MVRCEARKGAKLMNWLHLHFTKDSWLFQQTDHLPVSTIVYTNIESKGARTINTLTLRDYRQWNNPREQHVRGRGQHPVRRVSTRCSCYTFQPWQSQLRSESILMRFQAVMPQIDCLVRYSISASPNVRQSSSNITKGTNNYATRKNDDSHSLVDLYFCL